MSGFTLASQAPGGPNTTRGLHLGLTTDSASKYFAYGCGPNVVVRDMATFKVITCYQRHAQKITCVRLSPTGDLCASGDEQGTINVWTVAANPTDRKTIRACPGVVRDIAWDSDLKHIAVVGGDAPKSCQCMYNIEKGECVNNGAGLIDGPAWSCAWRQEKPFRLLFGDQLGSLSFVEGPQFKLKCSIPGHKSAVNCLRYSPDGKLVATVSSADDVIIVDGDTGAVVRSFKAGHKSSVLGVAWFTDGSKIATCGMDRTVHIFKADGTKLGESEVLSKGVDHAQVGILFTPKDEVISVSLCGDINVFSTDGKLTTVHRGHRRNILALSVCDELAGSVVSVGADGKVFGWDNALSTAKQLCTFPKEDPCIFAAKVRPNGTLIAHVDGNVVECDLKGGSVRTITAHAGGCEKIDILANGLIIVLGKNGFVAYNDKGEKKHEEKLMRFDASALATHGDTVLIGGENEVRQFACEGTSFTQKGKFSNLHQNSVVTAVAFSADGTLVASGDSNRKIAVWKPDGTVVRTEFGFHTSRITALDFGVGNKTLASAGFDGSLALWELGTQKVKKESVAHRNGVSALFVQGSSIVSAGNDAFVKKWSFDANF